MRRMVDSGRETSTGQVEYVFYIDDDDPASVEMASTLHHEKADVFWITGPRILMSSMWNECQKCARYDVYQHSCDETIYRTVGWDTAVLAAMDEWPDKIGLVYGRDGIHDQALATHGFITRNWVEAVGYFVPPYFSSDYNDLWLHQVAEAVGRLHFLPEVYTEHMHPAVNKGPLDLTHQERLTRHGQDGVDALYASLAGKRNEDVEKLTEAIQKAQVA
jgi:glycosyl transferase/beta-hydroxylase protein BlmF